MTKKTETKAKVETEVENETKTETNPEADTGFGKISLKAETHVVAPGRHLCTISDVVLRMNRDQDTKWLFITTCASVRRRTANGCTRPAAPRWMW